MTEIAVNTPRGAQTNSRKRDTQGVSSQRLGRGEKKRREQRFKVLSSKHILFFGGGASL